MPSHNRIESTSISDSVPRQTPKNDFGSVLADTMSSAAAGGASLVGGILGIGPVTSAAVNGFKASAARPGAVGALTTPGSGGSPGVAPSGAVPVTMPAFPTTGLPLDPNATPQSLIQQVASNDPSSAAFLQLQMWMQEESQQFSATSNVLKVRSDSAKSAINNIR
jgi:hypothetical protein